MSSEEVRMNELVGNQEHGNHVYCKGMFTCESEMGSVEECGWELVLAREPPAIRG